MGGRGLGLVRHNYRPASGCDDAPRPAGGDDPLSKLSKSRAFSSYLKLPTGCRKSPTFDRCSSGNVEQTLVCRNKLKFVLQFSFIVVGAAGVVSLENNSRRGAEARRGRIFIHGGLRSQCRPYESVAQTSNFARSRRITSLVNSSVWAEPPRSAVRMPSYTVSRVLS